MANNKRSTRKADTSPYVHQRRKSDIKFDIQEKIPWTDKQKEFFQLAQNNEVKMILLKGPAGTSKTIVSVYSALKALNEGKVSDIVYIRSLVESAEKTMGALPGTVEDKIGPYLRPLVDKLEELLSVPHQKALLSNGLVEGSPINFLRGAHFAGKYILLDEAQNFSLPELTTAMTRVGEFCKVIISGDTFQADIGERKSGFGTVCDMFDTELSQQNGIHVFEFGKEDIVRSELVRFIVGELEKYHKSLI